jgi:hypothetical protein
LLHARALTPARRAPLPGRSYALKVPFDAAALRDERLRALYGCVPPARALTRRHSFRMSASQHKT